MISWAPAPFPITRQAAVLREAQRRLERQVIEAEQAGSRRVADAEAARSAALHGARRSDERAEALHRVRTVIDTCVFLCLRVHACPPLGSTVPVIDAGVEGGSLSLHP